MTPEAAFETCLNALETGEMSLEQCIEQFPDLASLLQLALGLQSVEIPAATPLQVQTMQERIFSQVNVSTAPAPNGRFLKPIIGVLIAVILLLSSIIVFLLFQPDQLIQAPISTLPPTNAVTLTFTSTMTATASPTATLTHTATASPSSTGTLAPTASPTATFSLTPAPTATRSSVQVPSTDEDAPPIQLELSGRVEFIDEEANTVTLDGVLVELDMSTLPETLTVGTPLTISGELQENGTLISETITPTDEASLDAPEDSTCPQERCHPVLLILSQSYQTDYMTLETMHRQEQLGMAEIARMLAITEASGVELATIQQQRQNGQSWGEILAQYPEVNPNTLGVTIRENQRPEQANPNANQGGNNGNNGGSGGPPADNPGAEHRSENTNNPQNGSDNPGQQNNNGNGGNPNK
jgi:hypothetical protein